MNERARDGAGAADAPTLPAGAAGATPPESATEPTAAPPEARQPAALLGDRYELEREPARGGGGRVLLARDRRLGRPVALETRSQGCGR
jgi:hypothetical protein